MEDFLIGMLEHKMDSRNTIIAGLSILILVAIFFIFSKVYIARNPVSVEGFNLYQAPPEILLAHNVRVANLYLIVEALNKYKNDHHQYPISNNKGNDWSSIYTTTDTAHENWIEGLAPKYILQLPVDPRQSTNKLEQYAYQSDGANYKLVAFYPPDCAEVYAINPKMLVTVGNKCVGYGFWTKRANWYSLPK